MARNELDPLPVAGMLITGMAAIVSGAAFVEEKVDAANKFIDARNAYASGSTADGNSISALASAESTGGDLFIGLALLFSATTYSFNKIRKIKSPDDSL